MTGVRVRRVYEEPDAVDGQRVLVDRVWPRGVRKEDARLDDWVTAVAPSTELRKWYGHEVGKFDEFRERYLVELDTAERRDALAELRNRSGRRTLTLLTATKDVAHSHAAVLVELLTDSS